MNFHKIVFLIAFLGIFAGGFFMNAQPAQAATVEELLALITQLKAQIAQLQQQLAQSEGQSATWCYDFNTNIRLGDSGDEVYALQSVLLKEGLFGESDETSDKTFGEQTASAVVGFQQKYASEILRPFGLKFGTGFVGKGTRAKLNALYGCGVAQPPVPGPVPTPTPIPQPVLPSITVLSPNEGFLTWRVGETQIITWQSRGLNSISLSLETASDIGQIARTITKNVPASNGSYSWKILSEFGGSIGNVFVRSADSGSTVYGVGSANINIVSATTTQPSLAVLSPIGGELSQGVSYSVTWQTGDFSRISIYLDKADPTLASIVIADNILNTGSYAWTIKDTASGSYKIRICEYRDAAVAFYAVSCSPNNRYFSIASSTQLPVSYAAPEMVYPQAGQILNYGAPNGYLFKVKLVAGASGYLFGFFQNGVMIYENWRDDKKLSSDGEFAVWPDSPFYSKFNQGDVQVWVRALVNNQWSEARIITVKLVSPVVSPSSITLLSPNGGEKFQQGAAYKVTWQSTGISAGNVKITTCMTVASYSLLSSRSETRCSLPLPVPNSGLYQSTFGAAASLGDYTIKIEDAANPSVFDESNAPFSIVSAATITPSITVPSPDLAIYSFSVLPTIPYVGQKSTLTINVSNQGNATAELVPWNLDISSAVTVTPLPKFTTCSTSLSPGYNCGIVSELIFPSAGVYTIGLSLDASNQIKESDETNNTSNLSVTAVNPPSAATIVNVLSPNGGEQWVIGKTYNITWSTNAGAVNIELWKGTTFIQHIAIDVIGAAGSYSWTIPSNLTSGSDYKIYVSIMSKDRTYVQVYDTSDNYFSIVSATTSTPSITSFNYTETDAYTGSIKFYWTNDGTDSVNLWIPCYAGLTIKNAATGANFFCGESDLKLPSNSSVYLKFTNSSGSTVNANAIIAPITSSATSITIYSNYSKTINFSIVSAAAPSSLRNIEDQTASIADAVSRLLQSFEEFKKSNP